MSVITWNLISCSYAITNCLQSRALVLQRAYATNLIVHLIFSFPLPLTFNWNRDRAAKYICAIINLHCKLRCLYSTPHALSAATETTLSSSLINLTFARVLLVRLIKPHSVVIIRPFRSLLLLSLRASALLVCATRAHVRPAFVGFSLWFFAIILCRCRQLRHVPSYARFF